MAIVQMPVDLMIGSFSFGQQRYDMAEMSDATGDVAVRLFGPPRWRIGMGSSNGLSLVEGSKWESLVLQLRGRVNTLAAFDPVRIAPQGTLRGAPFVWALAAGGVNSLVLGNAIGTLLRGDLLQLGSGLGSSQLVKLTADAASTVLTAGSGVWRNNASAVATWVNNASAAATWAIGGTMTINFEPPLRQAYAAQSAVVWSYPTAYFKATNPAAGWNYRPGSVGALEGYSLDLLEVFG